MIKKRAATILLALVMALSLLPVQALAAEAGTYTVGEDTAVQTAVQPLAASAADITGTGTADDPYLIYTADGLKAFRDIVNGSNGQTQNAGAHAKLMNDIVLNDGTFDEDGNYTKGESGEDAEPWTPIGGGYPYQYSGTFDGNRHTIKGLYVKDAGYAGLFGSANGAAIKDVTVTGYVSGVMVGGIVGCGVSMTITGCTNAAAVKGSGDVGGIIGFHEAASARPVEIRSCVNLGTVSAASPSGGVSVGGIAGVIGTYPFPSSADDKHLIADCYNAGKIQMTIGDTEGNSSNRMGGIVGVMRGMVASIENCCSVGTMTYTSKGEVYIGGIAGEGTNLTSVANCYWLEGIADQTVGYAIDSANPSGCDKTKAQFADGTVLALLKGDRTDSPWDKCGYVEAAGMTLPLLNGQTADAHTCTPEDASQWEHDASGHWQVCSCGLFVNKGGHTGGTATCKGKAMCSICGAEYGQPDPNNHTGGTELKNARAAACTEKGYSGDTYCKGCGIKLSDGKDIPGTGHSLKHVSAKRSTTRTEGNIEYWYCDGCGKYYKDAAAAKEITRADTVIAKRSGSSGFTGTTSNTTSGTGKDTVKSSDTGDAGIALYGVMALLSLTGGAWLTAKKRK